MSVPAAPLPMVLPCIVAALAALAGCPQATPGPEPTPTPEETLPDPAEVDLSGPCPLEDRFGGFVVQSWEGYSIVQGQAADGVVPVTILEQIASEGGCWLLRRNNPICEPPCEPGQTCDFDGICIPYPERQDLGTVVVEGLVLELEIDPVMPGYTYFATSLPHPATRPDETIRVTTGAGAWDPVELWGVGIQQLTIDPEVAWRLEEGQEFALRWEPPLGDVRSEVAFQLTIDQHGITPTRLACLFADTGEAAVPAALLDALFSAGVSGWPSAWMIRRTVDSTSVGDGCLELEVAAPRTADVELVGYIPCDAAHPCPEGLECDLDIELCQ